MAQLWRGVGGGVCGVCGGATLTETCTGCFDSWESCEIPERGAGTMLVTEIKFLPVPGRRVFLAVYI